MKRLIAILFAIVIMFTLTCCSLNNPNSIVSGLAYQPGEWNKGTYNSAFLNTSIVLSGNWYSVSEKELAREKQVIIKESMGDTDATEEEVERGVEYELKIANETSQADLSIVHKDMDIIYSMAYSEEDILNAYKQNMQNLSNDDMHIISMSSPQWVPLGENEYYMLEIEYSYQRTMTTYQRIYLRKIGTYMTTLTMSAIDKAEFNRLEDMFGPYIKQ